jgi:glycosidase/predicted alpha/beta superfamily hydrolase
MQDFSPVRRLTSPAGIASSDHPMTLKIRLVPGLLASLAAFLLACAEPSAPAISVPRFIHPGAGQVCYFLLTDRFANGSPANDTGGISGGPDFSGFDPTRISHYHGGDFTGVTAKLDYLKDLGVTAVWVTPPFRNKAMQSGTAGYHGYWILDFLHVDPHLGTDADFHEFVKQAHARGLKVYLDIIVNHTADVIQYQGGITAYVPKSVAPYRDANGRPFDEQVVAFNGLNSPAAFPRLSAERSFAYVPIVPPAEHDAKNPAWLNNPIYYHNRGNSVFSGENSLHGDFFGLDDVFTEHPEVVSGFVEIYRHWLEEFKVDGFRIDTAKHVNVEFWQAFAPAIRDLARRVGNPGFIQFGEVMDETLDAPFLSEFSHTALLDTTLDFGFMHAALAYVSKEGNAAAVGDFLALDDYYTGPANNVHTTTTFLGNHDLGRFGYFLRRDNPAATPAQLADLVKLGHGLLLLSRGQPVIYYGDEQGMIGRGGKDMQAREDMFASQSPDFKNASLLGTARTGADDKFDEQHPFFRTIHALAALRTSHPALRRGSTIVRPSANANLLAFSRIERVERVEYLATFNNSRTAAATAAVPTSQPAGATLRRLYDSQDGADKSMEVLTADAHGQVAVSLAPLQFAVWAATAPLTPTAQGPAVAITAPAGGAELKFPLREKDGHAFPVRQEIHAEVTGGDGVAEVTFTLTRASRPGQAELLGTDDAAPYRVFWRPPADLAPGEELAFTATVDDLRGHRTAARAGGIKVAAGTPAFGQKGALTPVLKETPPPNLTVAGGAALTLAVRAEGTGSFEYQWLHDGAEIAWATGATYSVPQVSAAYAGEYRVLVHNPAGTSISPPTLVTVTGAGRVEKQVSFLSRFVAPREIDVWLPPGYDENPAERYPVIYMHDGQNLFDPTISYGGRSWEVDRAMCRLIQAGKTRGAIIVGIWNTGATRAAEYMPQKAVATGEVQLAPGMPALPASAIQSDAYLKFLVGELKPYIDRTYRTQPEAVHTSIMGSSMGGLISAYAIAEYPDVFGGAGCVSTHWPAGDGIAIDYFAKHLPRPGRHRLYFDFGTATLDAGYEPYQQRMDAALRAAGYTENKDWTTRKFPGAEHSEKSWRARVEIPFLFLLGM